ncbi:hypothetical protein [Streptomyces chryseus]|uniref:hypothetical protein n=1 Tax=Streptomyces chryseus TaxID=68186 RepID=UPI00199A19D7|nr:hypothetical protein [Streptomyces chryseus]GGX44709.1 hypothetical protein GCM10010353_69460 [Streptomyces chryseus]
MAALVRFGKRLLAVDLQDVEGDEVCGHRVGRPRHGPAAGGGTALERLEGEPAPDQTPTSPSEGRAGAGARR